MKKFLFATALFMAHLGAFANGEETTENKSVVVAPQDAVKDTTWKFNALLGLNFNQAYFNNWAAGGQNSVAFTAKSTFWLKMKKGKHSWENMLDLAYGQTSQADQSPFKTDDKIEFQSVYGYQLNNEHWYASLLYNFKTQFQPGYLIEDGVEIEPSISDFMAPAFQYIALGFDYKPNEAFTAFLSPVTVKSTIVQIDRLTTDFGLDAGENARHEFGAYLNASYVKDIFENVNLNTKLELFSNYSENPQNVDMNWETIITMKVNSWLAAQITTQLIYDDDVNVTYETVEEEIGGEIVEVEKKGPRLQFKEVLSLGLTAKF